MIQDYIPSVGGKIDVSQYRPFEEQDAVEHNCPILEVITNEKIKIQLTSDPTLICIAERQVCEWAAGKEVWWEITEDCF